MNSNETEIEINERLNIIENKLDTILDLLKNDIDTKCSKMSNHIEFIEKIYENMKYPLEFICNKINNIQQFSLL
jgi:hypothetical protein